MKNQKWAICFSFGFKLLAFTMKISNTPGISFSSIWVYYRLLPLEQIIVKITIFLLVSTYLLSFLELASVKYLETCENDFGDCFILKKRNILKNRSISYFWWQKKKSLDKILSKNYVVKKASIWWTIKTFTKFHRRKHEKSERVFSVFACLWRHTISRRPRMHAHQKPTGTSGVFEILKIR